MNKKALKAQRKRFWWLGIVAGALLGDVFSGSGFLAGLFPDVFLLVVIIEAMAGFAFGIAFWIQLAVWWHDRPRRLKSFVDDPGLIS